MILKRIWDKLIVVLISSLIFIPLVSFAYTYKYSIRIVNKTNETLTLAQGIDDRCVSTPTTPATIATGDTAYLSFTTNYKPHHCWGISDYDAKNRIPVLVNGKAIGQLKICGSTVGSFESTCNIDYGSSVQPPYSFAAPVPMWKGTYTLQYTITELPSQVDQH